MTDTNDNLNLERLSLETKKKVQTYMPTSREHSRNSPRGSDFGQDSNPFNTSIVLPESPKQSRSPLSPTSPRSPISPRSPSSPRLAISSNSPISPSRQNLPFSLRSRKLSDVK